MMKFSTSSSSSSVASDSLSRKSTLCIYTENAEMPSLITHCEKMDSGSEAMELRRELDTVHRALQLQSASVLRHKHRVVELTTRLAARDARHGRERRLRDDQLAFVLRSLYLLEARLKREQKDVQRKLKQKDAVIQMQQEEIARLKSHNAYCKNCQQILGFTSEQTNIETDPEFQSLDSTDSRFHNGFTRSSSYHERTLPSAFQKNTRLSKSFQLPKHDTAYVNTSSSEEGNHRQDTVLSKGTFIKNKQAFVRKDVTRRSRKFSGRKHNSAYLEAIQKRYSSQANSSSAEECIRDSDLGYDANNCDKDDTADEITNDIERASLRIDQLINQRNESTKNAEETQKDSAAASGEKAFATRIERLHGIKRHVSEDVIATNRSAFLNNVLSNEPNENEDKPWYANISDPEPELESNYAVRGQLSYNRSKSADNLLIGAYSEGILKAEVVSAKNEVLCNNILKHNTEPRNGSPRSSEASQPRDGRKPQYGRGQVEVRNDLTETWYASTSDQDDGPSCEIYKNNPVLECVNQILLQNSLDESSNDTSKSSEAPSPRASRKRVQFSTLNSISFDESVGRNGQCTNRPSLPEKRPSNKIVKFSLETASEHSYEVPNTAEGYNYEVQSIYSNDYEPIITKGKEPTAQEAARPVPLPRTSVAANGKPANSVPPIRGSFVKNIAANIESRSSMNHYIDMESKYDAVPMKVVNRRKVPRTPPALPPKPKNLVSKFKFENATAASAELKQDSGTVAANQRLAEVTKNNKTKSASVEPDYCSISEINVPVVSNGRRENLLTQPSVEIHTEQFVCPKASAAKVATIAKLHNKISDKDIPRLPQVTEIIIPDDDDLKFGNGERFVRSSSLHVNSTIPMLEPRNSIQIGNSVSSILNEIKMHRTLDKHLPDNSSMGSSNSTQKVIECERQVSTDDSDKFDLSQNFEEFKIDDCEFDSIVAEEYRISSSTSDSGNSDIITEDINANLALESTTLNADLLKADTNVNNNYRIEFTADIDLQLMKDMRTEEKNHLNESGLENSSKVSHNSCPKLSNKPDLLSNIDNVETDSVRNSDIESSNSSGSNSGSYNTVKCEPVMLTKNTDAANTLRTSALSFEIFLESSGLSSKSISGAQGQLNSMLLPTRPPNSNHKNVLKPKDIKMRMKNQIATNKLTNTTAIKYFEPYL